MNAEIQTWAFDGAVTFTGFAAGLGAPFDAVDEGTPWAVSLTIDSDAPGNGGGGSWVYPAMSATLTVGDNAFPAVGQPEVLLFTGTGGTLEVLFSVGESRSASVFLRGIGDPLGGSTALPSSIDLNDWVTTEAFAVIPRPQTSPASALVGDVASAVIPATPSVLLLAVWGVVPTQRRR